MTDGTIEGCRRESGGSPSRGGGVFVKHGTFNMSDGTIKGCKAEPNSSSPPKPGQGGGVFVKQGTFNMSGGKVSGNTADKGGGIYGEQSGYNLGVIKILGGEVSGNTATSNVYAAGGGIYSKHQLTVSGSAEIKDNTAPNGSGGGIFIAFNGAFDFTGGTVSGNTADEGNGIYLKEPANSSTVMKMSGSATVTEGNDVFLNHATGPGQIAYVVVTGPLSKTLAATLTMKDDNDGYAVGRLVVKGDGYALKEADIGKFPITPQASTAQNWTTELDTVNNKLKLKE